MILLLGPSQPEVQKLPRIGTQPTTCLTPCGMGALSSVDVGVLVVEVVVVVELGLWTWKWIVEW